LPNLRCKIATQHEDKEIKRESATYKAAKTFDEYNSETMKVLGVPFGGPIAGRDSDGEAFHPYTEIGMTKGDSVPVTYYHGFGPDDPEGWQETPVFIGRAVYTGKDKKGHWFDVRLDTEEPLAQRIINNIKTSRASSGAVSHLVRMGKASLIDVWPIGELAMFDKNEWRQPANDFAIVGYKTILEEPKAEAKAEEANPAKLVKEGNYTKTKNKEIKKMAEDVKGLESKEVLPVKKVPEVDIAALFAKMEGSLTDKFEAKLSKLDEMLTVKSAPAIGKKITGKFDADPEVDEFLHWATTGQKSLATKAALQEGTTTEGGYLVPDGFAGRIIAKRDEQSIMRKMGAQVVKVSGDVFQVPTEDGAVTPARVAEEGATNESEPTFGRVDITTHKVDDLIKISEELEEDDAAGLSPYLANHVARQFALWENDAFFVGTGSSEPDGVFQSGTAAFTSDYATTIAASEIPELYFDLAGEYRDAPNAYWAMADSTAGLIYGLSGDQFQFMPTPAGVLEQQLMGKRLFTSSKIAAHTAALKSMVFGDFSYYMITERRSLYLFRNPYLYAGNGQIGLTWKTRVGGAVLQAEAFQYVTAHS